MVAHQIAGLPIGEAILQMQFSEKAVSGRVKSTLALAAQHAAIKGLDARRLIVSQAWVAKGTKLKRIDIKGRGRHGIKEHQFARMHILLEEGKTRDELRKDRMRRVLNRVRSPGVVREDRVLTHMRAGQWTW